MTETHLDKSIDSNAILFNTDKQIYRNDRNIYGGGVMIAVNAQIESSPISINLSTHPVEAVAVYIPKQQDIASDFVIICIYIPPGYTTDTIGKLNEIFEYICSRFPKSHILAVGDFNCPDIEWESYTIKKDTRHRGYHQSFLNCLYEHSLKQMVREPTHCRGNILDLVLTSDSSFIDQVNVVEPGLSDHFLVEVGLNLTTTDKLASKNFYFLYDKADTDSISEVLLQSLNNIEDAVNSCRDIDYVWSLFENSIKSAVTDFVPRNIIKPRNNNEPIWFNSAARKAVCKQRKLYNRYKTSNSPNLFADYKKIRRENKKLLRKIESEYYNRVLFKPLSAGSSKPFYSFIRRKQGRKNSPPARTSGATTVIDTVNSFNKYFQSVFSESGELNSVPSYNLPVQCPIRVSTEGVRKMIEGLKMGKAPGPDGLKKEDLMIDVGLVSSMLTLIFQYSLDTGSLPSAWKLAHVAPVFKKGDKTLAENYRPVSLTSIVCKMLEHIILSHINQSLILSSQQHGFRQGLSCTTQLVTVVNDLMKANNEKQQVHAAILDFSKAFDRVSHSLLIKKLLKADVDNSIVFWIQNFLSNRCQRVVVDGLASRSLRVHSGVPQGSVLGPTLFLIYIDDIGSVLKHSTIRLFADDALLYANIESQQDRENFQADLTQLEHWATRSKMTFNVAKCQIIDFNFSSNTGISPDYQLYERLLEIVDHFKYLGVTINNTLNWDSHIDIICSKALRSLGMLKQVLFNAPEKVKRIAYLTICRPILEYACEVWDPFLVKHICQLENIQRKAVRFICGLKGIVSVTEAQEKIELETLSDRRRRARIKLLVNILSNNTHSSLIQDFNGLTVQQTASHQHDTRSVRCSAPLAFYSNTNTFYYGFIQRTSRDIRLNGSQ